MARKVYTIENLNCANCAAKIEEKFNTLPEVEEAVITFATKQLRLTAADPDSLIEKLTQIAQTVEREAYIRSREDRSGERHQHRHDSDCGHGHGHEHDCGCGHHGCGRGHDHHDHDHCGCHDGECHYGHHHDGPHHGASHEHTHEHHHGNDEKKTILLGAELFAVGLVLNLTGLDIGGFLAFVAAYIVLGREIIAAAWKNLRGGHVLDENFLMSIASLGALPAWGHF